MSDVNYLQYAQNMGARNPMADGLNQISATVNANRLFELQKAQTDRANRLSDLQYEVALAAKKEAERKATYETGQREFIKQKMQPVQVENPAYSQQMQGLEMANNPPNLAENAPVFNAYQQSIQPTQQDLTAEMTAQGTPQTVSQTPNTHPLRLQMDYARQQGDAEKMQALADKAMEAAKNHSHLTGNPADIATAFEQMTGVPTKFMGKTSTTLKLGMGDTAWEVPLGDGPPVQIAAGNMKPEAIKTEKVVRPSADGKTEQVFLVNATTGEDIKPLTEVYPVKSQVPKIVLPSAPKGEKDMPSSVQDKITAKLETYNDYSKLKDTFKPEFMPKTPFKNIGEFQISLNKVFGKNQAAVDWWTQYFDARNILLKDRSGAAVMEPEFKRFEQGTIAANSNPVSVQNYLARSVGKYKSHVDAYVGANKGNHPTQMNAILQAFDYSPTGNNTSPSGNRGGTTPPRKSGRFTVEAL